MMYLSMNYKKTDKMCDLIREHYPILLVMSRFGIALGFGEQTIGEVCRRNGVDAKTFLTVVNMLVNKVKVDVIDEQVSITSLIDYLRNAHTYFLDFRLPAIRSKLIEAIAQCSESDVVIAIIRYFDEYVGEVRKHMLYEEETVFPYAEALTKGKRYKGRYNINIFIRHHDNIESKLSELKDIIIKYFPAKSSNELNSVLFDIFSCANDLASHNDVENYLFVPTIKQIEKSLTVK